ncbi:phosphoesterase PA-phosphatase related protein [Alicyclobacillus hesperidum URH17-3-68]|uniref:phosphatase PAP2 family protein n=1 Tax=Alicyclobacillus hesperidum TaxID=89784 RepID=UPI000281C374|nr:phosphatase PAP2 family protein [Alicyclobacillus hesperidum]EJY54868.1 phosphoesterase PA-phosphatase related protein [Alicyclobacillus hesperidum URH17-3-68]
MPTPTFPLPEGFGWQYHLIRWIQSFHTPWLDKLAVGLSFLGTESVYLLILPILFLAVNRTLGMRLAYVFLTSMYTNAWLKSVFHVARPLGVPGIRSGYISSATGLSMPSGHAQGTMTFFAGIAKWFRRRYIMWIGIILVAAIGISRIYLGLHWPLDVVVGWGIGLLIGICGWQLGRWWTYRQVPFPIALAFSVVFPALLLAVDHHGAAGVYAAFLMAIGAGAAIERQFLHTDIQPAFWKRICVAIIALAGIVAIQWAVQARLEQPLWQYVRVVLVAAWTTLGAPWLFWKLDLYRQEDARDIVR